MEIVAKQFSPTDFPDYLSTLEIKLWSPKYVVVHHCAAPNLAQRPIGFQHQHMLNLREYYEGLGWSAGPHFFIDDSSIWAFSPVTRPGVHAVSFNKSGVGLEMLGDYDSEDPWTGRGRKVLTTTAKAVRALLEKLNLTPDAVRFHRDDPKTQKSCPGSRISKQDFLGLLSSV